MAIGMREWIPWPRNQRQDTTRQRKSLDLLIFAGPVGIRIQETAGYMMNLAECRVTRADALRISSR